MKIRYAPLALACALMGAGAAQAASVTYNFGGTLDSVASELSFLAIGDSFTGSFTFESSSVDVSLVPDQAIYNAAFALNATVGGYSFSSNTTASDCPACGSFGVTNGSFDVFLARNSYAPVTGPNPGGFAPDGLAVLLLSNAGTALSSVAFPSEAEFTSFDYRQFSISFSDVEGSGRGAGGAITYLTLATAPPVPEASTSAMRALGLGALGVAARRKKRG